MKDWQFCFIMSLLVSISGRQCFEAGQTLIAFVGLVLSLFFLVCGIVVFWL